MEELTPIFKFSTPRQERIYKGLGRIGRGPAAFYRDACILMENVSILESTTHVVGHLFREIEGALRKALTPIRGKTEKGDNEHRRSITAVLKGLEIPESEAMAAEWLAFPNSLNALHKSAHRDGLHPPRPVNLDSRTQWDTVERILDFVLKKYEAQYISTFEILDGLLAVSDPNEKDAEQLAEYCPNGPDMLAYFFTRVDSPKWISLLRDKGYFGKPSEHAHHLEVSANPAPAWPQSDYLKRMAGAAPKAVKEIIIRIPDFDNRYVFTDLVEAVSAMPPEVAVELVPAICRWIEASTTIWFPQNCATLITRLAEGEEAEGAVCVSRALLRLFPNPAIEADTARMRAGLLVPEIVARFEEWQYAAVLKQMIPALAEHAKMDSLAMVCEILDSALELSKPESETGTRLDWGHREPPAIEEHEQNETHGTHKESLVFAIRDIAECIIEQEGRRVLEMIELREQTVFKRIGLHLRRRFPNVDPEGTAKILGNVEIYARDNLFHEMFHLLRTVFGDLPEVARNAYLEYVEREENSEYHERSCKMAGQPPPSAGELERFQRLNKFKKLLPVQHALTGGWKQRFEELATEFGQPEHPDFLSYLSTAEWVQPNPPKSVNELKSMPIEELTSYLDGFKRSDDPFDGTSDGLNLALISVVSSDPNKYALRAESFRGRRAPHVYQFLSGIHDSIKAGARIEHGAWPPVLNLCKWVTEQPRAARADESGQEDGDSDWRWSCKTVGDLLATSFRPDEPCLPFEFRNLAWEVLEALTRDPDVGRADKDLRFVDVAINSVRGSAMDAVLQYAIWIRRYYDDHPAEHAAKGFNAMPEVRDVLDFHLNLQHEPSLAIRSFYGRSFPWLVLLDEEWAAGAITSIFAEDENYFDAAWETYVTFCRPYTNVCPLLQNEYSRAITMIGKWSDESTRHGHPDNSLAIHIAEFFRWGLISIEDEEGLMHLFYQHATDEMRGHALDYLGRCLCDASKEDVDSATAERLNELLEWRLATIRGADDISHNQSELSSFGPWFASGKYDDLSLLNYLKEVLELVGWVAQDDMVVQRLDELSTNFPIETVECVALMVEGSKERWDIYRWKDQIRKIVSTALASKNDAAIEAARKLVNLLALRGYTEYRDLLA